MGRSRRHAAALGRSAAAAAPDHARLRQDLSGVWNTLTRPRGRADSLKPHEMTFLYRNLATLVSNGVSLPKALATLAKEDSLSRHRELLESIRRKVETGASFSSVLAEHPGVCDRVTAAQIRVGERAGLLADTLQHLAENRDQSRELRRQIVKKLAYPGLLVFLGSALVAFLLLYVVPVFEKTYDDAGVPLPFITQALINFGAAARRLALPIVGAAGLSVLLVRTLRKNEELAAKMDRAVLHSPLVGIWMRDVAVLQLMEVLNSLMTAGYTLVEALGHSAESVSNRAVRSGVRDLQRAVKTGERFSRELERHEELFPPIVNQLVIVGESTGQLTRATLDICEHLRREIERKTTLMVGTIEPILTISLAAAISVILLAIYLPMFDMVNTVAK